MLLLDSLERMSITVSVVSSGKVVTVRFSDPDSRNPLSAKVLERLHEFTDNLIFNSNVETVVFTGSGNVFASGANLREIAGLDSRTAPEFARFGQSLMGKIASMQKTTIAAVNGFCFGGALDLALACDKRIASPDATFAHPGAGLGIITGWGGTQRLPRLVGQANALEMFFTAAPVDAARALTIGLVDLVADDVFDNECLRLR